jgi:hypothetical protein
MPSNFAFKFNNKGEPVVVFDVATPTSIAVGQDVLCSNLMAFRDVEALESKVMPTCAQRYRGVVPQLRTEVD